MTRQLYATRSEHSKRVLELQHSITQTSQELESAKRQAETAAERSRQLQDKADRLSKELEASREERLQVEQDFRSELLNKDKLLKLYKSEAALHSEKAEELRQSVTSLQRLLSEAQKDADNIRNERSEEIEKIQQVGVIGRQKRKKFPSFLTFFTPSKDTGLLSARNSGITPLFPPPSSLLSSSCWRTRSAKTRI